MLCLLYPSMSFLLPGDLSLHLQAPSAVGGVPRGCGEARAGQPCRQAHRVLKRWLGCDPGTGGSSSVRLLALDPNPVMKGQIHLPPPPPPQSSGMQEGETFAGEQSWGHSVALPKSDRTWVLSSGLAEPSSALTWILAKARVQAEGRTECNCPETSLSNASFTRTLPNPPPT